MADAAKMFIFCPIPPLRPITMLSAFFQLPYAPFLLLLLSNIFMTMAWYGHLKFLHNAPVWQAVLMGWGLAFFEYLFMVPANRLLEARGYSLGQMKISQEVITLLVFVPFMLLLFKQPFRLDYVWAALCLMGAVFFVFRSA